MCILLDAAKYRGHPVAAGRMVRLLEQALWESESGFNGNSD